MSDLVQKIREALAKITPWCSCQGRATCIGCLIEGITKEHHGQSGVDFLLDHIEAGQWLSEAADRIEEMDRFIKMLLVYPNIKETIGLDMYDWAEHVVRREPEKETP